MISIEQLTAEKFAPFGDVIDYEDPHDAVFLDDTTDIVSDVACIDATSRKGRAQVDILRLTPQALPVTIASVLRNQDATTAFDVGPALACLGTLFRFHGLSFDAETADIVRIARRINKYRSVLGQVLLASFFLQLFGLISPLFFQVVVDKVLVHRGVSTLDVLLNGRGGVTVARVWPS